MSSLSPPSLESEKENRHVVAGVPRRHRSQDRQTPQQLLDEAAELGYGPQTKSTVVVNWLKDEYGLGRGHAMALYGVLKNGPTVPEKHVGSSGSHRDESLTLRLDGVAARSSEM